MSLPNDMGSLSKQFRFSVLYTVAVVFAFVNSTLYWFVTRQQKPPRMNNPRPPHEPDTPSEASIIWGRDADISMPLYASQMPFGDLLSAGWFKAFVIFNLYAVTSIIMVIEIFFLNSIKRPFAIGSHFLVLILLSGLYLGWAGIGKALTGWPAFAWLDESKVGSLEAVAAYCIGFLFLAPLMYILMQGFVAMRENMQRSLTESRAMAAAEASAAEDS